MFRELLGSGMTAHIQGNELLREVFQMGAAPLTTVESKASRLERVGHNNIDGRPAMVMYCKSWNFTFRLSNL
jgi:hypothetical protein